MRKIFIVLFSFCLMVFSFQVSYAQNMDNAIFVQEVVSPTQDAIYSLNDTVDFIVRVRNQGPNALIPGDQLNLTYSLGNGSDSASVSFDTLIVVRTDNQPFGLAVGELREYVVAKDMLLNGTSFFSACADLSRGSVIYPNNTNKNSGDCALFTVGLDNFKIEINQLYYANSTLYFTLNQSHSLNIEVYDITGKTLLRRALSNEQNQSIPFNHKTKGFYFLKIADNNGNSSTAKFVIN